MTWWHDRTAREQRMIALAGAVVLIVFAVQFVLLPVQDYRQNARSEYEAARSYLTEVQYLAAQIEQQKKAQDERLSPLDGTSVRARVTAEAARLELQVNRIQPDREGGLTVWIDDADPGRVMTWLVDLNQTSGLALGAVSMRQINTAGDVQTQVTFVTGADE